MPNTIRYAVIAGLTLLSGYTASYADVQTTLDAVDEVMFEFEKVGPEFVSYVVVSEGHVSLTVDESVPDDIYVELIQSLRAHKDIRSVLAGRDDICGGTYIVR